MIYCSEWGPGCDWSRGMALFRLEAKIFSREKRGRSIIAAAAYRAGTKIRDEIRDKIFDYSRRSKGVVNSTILTPEGAPEWTSNPCQLWNAVEAGEKRVDAQLAREFILAVPPELSAEAQFQTAVDWAKKELVSSGMVAEVSLHHTKTGKNPHVHILCTMRKLDGEKFSSKKSTEWNDVALLVKQRESWAEAVNTALEKAGRNERVDHRSLKDRGIDRVPEPKIGVAATAMKRRGILDDPERHQLVRRVKLLNAVRPMMKAIKERGEVYQVGLGRSWWEKSITFMSRIREQADKVVRKSWWNRLDTRQQIKGKDGPQIGM
jgi:ATP-dependent exoDNAse (exonuclease V) alpha subunit